MEYCVVKPPPKEARPESSSKILDSAWSEGSLQIVSATLHKRHETQVDRLRKLDRERNYWWGMVYAFPAPPPATLIKWSPKCKAALKGVGQPTVELYPPYLATLNDLVKQSSLDFRLFPWLENIFDGLTVMSADDLRPRYLTSSTLLLVAKDSHHPQPRFVMNLGCTTKPNDFILPPEVSTMGEEAYLDRFNGLTPTSVSPRKHLLKDNTRADTSQAYATFLLGMVLMALLTTSSLRYEKRDLYDDLSALADEMTAFNPLRRPSLPLAKEHYMDLLASHDVLRDLDMVKPPLSTLKPSKPQRSKTKKRRRSK